MHHTIVHFEIFADEIEKLARFYRNVFGWKVERMPGPMEYWQIETVPTDSCGKLVEPGVNGGMIKKENPEQRSTNYILVESVDEYARKIAENGGKVIVSKQEVPGICYFALALDPEGNQFGILEEKR